MIKLKAHVKVEIIKNQEQGSDNINKKNNNTTQYNKPHFVPLISRVSNDESYK